MQWRNNHSHKLSSIRLSSLTGVNIFVVPSRHTDLMPNVSVMAFYNHLLKKDPALKGSCGLFIETTDDHPTELAYNFCESSNLDRCRDNEARPSTPRASFDVKDPALKKMSDEFYEHLGMTISESDKTSSIVNEHPNIVIKGVDDPELKKEEEDLLSFYADPNKTDKEIEEVMQRIYDLAEERNGKMANNILSEVIQNELKVAIIVTGTVHEFYGPKIMPLSDELKNTFEFAGIPYGVATLPFSRHEEDRTDKDEQISREIKTGEDKMERLSFAYGAKPTNTKICVVGDINDENYSAKIYEYAMNELLKTGYSRRTPEFGFAMSDSESDQDSPPPSPRGAAGREKRRKIESADLKSTHMRY